MRARAFQTLTAQRDLALAELDLVNAKTAYQKSKVELERATGTTLADNGVQVQEAVDGDRACRETTLAKLEPKLAGPNAGNVGHDRTSRRAPRRILAADDQPHILEAIELLLRPEGYVVDTAKSPAAVRESLACEIYDAVLIDLNYTRDTTSGPGRSRPALADRLVRQQPAGDRHDRVGQCRTGRRSDAARRARLHPEALGERAPAGHHSHAGGIASRAATNPASWKRKPDCSAPKGRPDFIASAPSMQPVLQTMARIGPSDANVLVTGEHGTGKEVVAQTLHILSPRASMPLVAVNTGALAGRHVRERALRTRERRVHRRAHRPHRTL